ncbi:hypothetical protein B4135_2534 [Caldibacillus debilis]|uniref:Uncharacterized protein n=1 Tax=Caldibacillus debilis TaxID=301148 RepID=A0A150LZX8_9BACI|nr:hypothetical protein B4135_2534 [Caldibacillus debilis]
MFYNPSPMDAGLKMNRNGGAFPAPRHSPNGKKHVEFLTFDRTKSPIPF